MNFQCAFATFIIVMSRWAPRYFDIGVNFSDSMFQGVYHGSVKHKPDLEAVIARARLFRVERMLVTSSTISESEDHVQLAQKHPGVFYSTVGVHPCTVAEEFYCKGTEDLLPDVDEKLNKLREIAVNGTKTGAIKAFGEIGLDYDRLHYSSKDQQRTFFSKQLEIAASLKHLQLPLFLHMRNAVDDFVSILKPFVDRGDFPASGVVHSFTGTEKELHQLLQLGFKISVNGCSLKTSENLEVAAKIPRSQLLIETDAPWCEIRKSHASHKLLTSYPNLFYPEIPGMNDMKELAKGKKFDERLPFPTAKSDAVDKIEESLSQYRDSVDPIAMHPLVKSRNEPVFVGQVAQIMCSLYGLEEPDQIQVFLDEVYERSCQLFGVD